MHRGTLVSSSVRRRCYAKMASANNDIGHGRDYSDSDADSSESEDVKVRRFDAVDKIVYRSLMNWCDHNPTQAMTSASLMLHRDTIGPLLAPHDLRRIPKTAKRLRSKFRNDIESIFEFPICPAQCSFLPDDEKSSTSSGSRSESESDEVLAIDGKEKVLSVGDRCQDCNMPVYDYTRIRHNRVPIKVFRTTSISSTIKKWLAHPRIRRLLAYGRTYQHRHDHYDVMDGKLWQDYRLKHPGKYDLFFVLVTDPIETNTGKHSRQYQVCPYLLICLNLPPWLRSNPAFVMLFGVAPGPKPKNHQLFLRLLARSFATLERDGLACNIKGEVHLVHAALMLGVNDLRVKHPLY